MGTVTTSTRRAAAKVAAPAAALKASAKAERRATITDAMRNEAAAAPSIIKGKAQLAAALRLASDAFAEGKARADLIADVIATFGKLAGPGNPLPEKIAADSALARVLAFVRQETVCGRAASRLPADAFPSRAIAADMGQRIAYLRDMRCFYAAPVEEGKAASALPKGKVGRMAPRVYQALRTGDAWTTLLLADAGLTNAQGQAAKNAKQADKQAGKQVDAKGRAPHHNAPAVKGKDETPVKVEYTAASFTAHIVLQLRGLEQQCNKQAKVCPTVVAAAIKAAIALVDKESKLQDKLVADRVTK